MVGTRGPGERPDGGGLLPSGDLHIGLELEGPAALLAEEVVGGEPHIIMHEKFEYDGI